MKFILTKG